MNSATDPHDQIRRLLVIKRHEHPPPGFFNSFSQKVIARIEAEAVASPKPRWRIWFAELARQPLLASTYGLLFAGLLIIAIGLAQSSPGNDLEGPGAINVLLSSPPAFRSEIGLPSMSFQPSDTILATSSSTAPVFSPFTLPHIIPDRASAIQP